MQFKVKGDGHPVWQFLLPRGAFRQLMTLHDGQIVTAIEERGAFVRIEQGWTKREWLEEVKPEPPLPPATNLFERIDRLEAWARTRGYSG